MRHNNLFWMMVLLFGMMSCSCTKYGIHYATLLWKTPITDRNEFYGKGHWALEIPIRENICMLGIKKNNNTGYGGLDIYTGELKWEWIYDEGDTEIHPYSISDNTVIFTHEPRKVFGIDIPSGRVEFDHRTPDRIAVGREVYNRGGKRYWVVLDDDNGEWDTQLYSFDPQDGYKRLDYISGKHELKTPLPYSKDGVDYVFLYYNKGDLKIYDTIQDKDYNAYAGLYDLTHDRLVYEDKQFENYSLGNNPEMIVGDRFYSISTHKLVCVDVMTGEVVWRSEEIYPEAPGEMLYYNNKIYVPRSSGNMFVYDAKNGEKIFEIGANGFTSALKVLNGVLYWTDAGSANLRAADAETGKMMWNIRSENARPFDLFATDIGVYPGKDGEKGRVIVHDYKHAYCYEAIN